MINKANITEHIYYKNIVTLEAIFSEDFCMLLGYVKNNKEPPLFIGRGETKRVLKKLMLNDINELN